MNPKYEVQIRIIDRETEEVIEQESAFIPNEPRYHDRANILGTSELSEEAAEMAFWDAMRHFRERSQIKHERSKEEEI